MPEQPECDSDTQFWPMRPHDIATGGSNLGSKCRALDGIECVSEVERFV
jgi:hypothetical protein